jgi:hypothetical protein
MRKPRTPKGSVAKIPKAISGPPPPKKKKGASKPKKDWIQELFSRGETQIQDPTEFSAQLHKEKMLAMTTDGGDDPNPGSAGWGVLIRQNGKSICLWKHYEKASNNVMELSAVIAGLSFLPPDMIIWLSTDSQYVEKGVNEWLELPTKRSGLPSKRQLPGTGISNSHG